MIFSRPPSRADIAELRGSGAGAEPFRPDLVERVRRQIDADTYENDRKLDIAADRLARDLDLYA